jgi:hypothetical protein
VGHPRGWGHCFILSIALCGGLVWLQSDLIIEIQSEFAWSIDYEMAKFERNIWISKDVDQSAPRLSRFGGDEWRSRSPEPGVLYMNANELKMDGSERVFWEQVRGRGSFWYLTNKGLAFLLLYPALGYGVMGWAWSSNLLVEGWLIGLAAGAFVWMRKELRYRFTLEEEGLPIPDSREE